jgi:diamine N-acetyltransferase
MIKGTSIDLRKLQPSDLSFLFEIENNPDHWNYSDIPGPYTKEELIHFIDESLESTVFETNQERFVIQDKQGQSVGFVDLFDCDFSHKRAGVGIVISSNERQKGYAKEALILLERYAKEELKLHQLFALISEENLKSISLFKGCGFEMTAIKQDWFLKDGMYLALQFYQKIL